MTPSVDPGELLAAQRLLRDRLLSGTRVAAETRGTGRAARDLAAEMLLYLDQPQACWDACMRWLLAVSTADRIDGGFASARDARYRPMFERRRPSTAMPSVLGAEMDARDTGVACVWSARGVVVFGDVASDRRLGAGMRAALLATRTRRKLGVALRDGGHDVGLLCVDADSVATAWTNEECLRVDSAAREVIGPILGALRRLGAAEPESAAPTENAGADKSPHRLTPAELRVAQLVIAGCNYKEMARHLDRSAATIDHQLRSLRAKLGVNSTAKLMRELVALQG